MPVYFPGTGGALYRVARSDFGPKVSFDNIDVEQDARDAAETAFEAAQSLTSPRGVAPSFGSQLRSGLNKLRTEQSGICVLKENLGVDGRLEGTSLFGGVFLGYILLALQSEAGEFGSEWDPLIVVSAPGSSAQAGLGNLSGLESKLRTVKKFAERRTAPVLFLHTHDPDFEPDEEDGQLLLRKVKSREDLVLALNEDYLAAGAYSLPPEKGASSTAPPVAGGRSAPWRQARWGGALLGGAAVVAFVSLWLPDRTPEPPSTLPSASPPPPSPGVEPIFVAAPVTVPPPAASASAVAVGSSPNPPATNGLLRPLRPPEPPSTALLPSLDAGAATTTNPPPPPPLEAGVVPPPPPSSPAPTRDPARTDDLD